MVGVAHSLQKYLPWPVGTDKIHRQIRSPPLQKKNPYSNISQCSFRWI